MYLSRIQMPLIIQKGETMADLSILNNAIDFQPAELRTLAEEVIKNYGIKVSELCERYTEIKCAACKTACGEAVTKSSGDVSEALRAMGVPARIKGYHYLRDAITLVMNDFEKINSVTKVLYPEVAEHFKTSPCCVERAIRHAIEIAWERGDIEAQEELFGYSVSSCKGKPTNSEFIAMIADYLLLKQKFS